MFFRKTEHVKIQNMTLPLLPQQINVYALVPYAFIPTLYQFDDKLLFGSDYCYSYKRMILQGTSIIHSLLAYTTIDKTVIDQAFANLTNKSWQQIILNYIACFVDCMTEFEQLHIEKFD